MEKEEFKPGLSKETLDELFEAHDPEDFIKEYDGKLPNFKFTPPTPIISSEKDELLIELEEWDHRCGDGCCYTYGTNIYVNGEQLENEDGTSSHQLLKAVLTKLGYANVRVEYK